MFFDFLIMVMLFWPRGGRKGGWSFFNQSQDFENFPKIEKSFKYGSMFPRGNLEDPDF